MKRSVFALLLSLCLAFESVGCIPLLALLPTITAVATTVTAVLGEIQKTSDSYFAAHPNADRQTKINALIDGTRTASLVASPR
jgi:hypothetical protein